MGGMGGLRGKTRQFADWDMKDQTKFQQLQQLEKTGVATDDMFDEDYLQWKAMQASGATNPMMYDEDAFKYQQLSNMQQQGYMTDEMFDEDFLRFQAWQKQQQQQAAKTALLKRLALKRQLFGEDAWKYQQLLDMKSAGTPMGPEMTKKLFDEDFLRYEAWKNSQTPGASQPALNPYMYGDEYWKYSTPTGGLNAGAAFFGEDVWKYQQLYDMKKNGG